MLDAKEFDANEIKNIETITNTKRVICRFSWIHFLNFLIVRIFSIDTPKRTAAQARIGQIRRESIIL